MLGVYTSRALYYNRSLKLASRDAKHRLTDLRFKVAAAAAALQESGNVITKRKVEDMLEDLNFKPATEMIYQSMYWLVDAGYLTTSIGKRRRFTTTIYHITPALIDLLNLVEKKLRTVDFKKPGKVKK